MSQINASDSRADNESAFHDEIAEEVDLSQVDVNYFFRSPTALENREILRFFGDDLRGKRLLDLGCGYGEASAYFGLQGMQVDGIDISEKMIQLANHLCRSKNLSCSFCRAPAEKLPFNDESFDFIYGNGVLHHVSLDQTISEIHRVLKPGGKAAFIEPLPYNPVINVYRKMASKYRSKDEQPLSKEQIRQVISAFQIGHHKEFWITGLVAFIWMYAVERVHPNDTPYWKRIIYKGKTYHRLFFPLIFLDRILGRLPGIRWLAWNSVILVTKENSRVIPRAVRL